MKNLFKTMRYLFYRLVSKKMLITIIFGLLCFILFNNCDVFATDLVDVFGNTYTVNDIPSSIDLSHGYYYLSRTKELRVLSNDSSYFYIGGPNQSSKYFFGVSGTCKVYKPSGNGWYVSKTENTGQGATFGDNIGNTYPSSIQIENGLCFYADCYTDISKTNLFYTPTPQIIEPYIINSQADLTGLLSETIIIDTGTNNINNFDDFNFIISQNKVGSSEAYFVYITDLDENSPFYKTGGINGDYFEIPISVFKTSLITGYEVNYSLQWWINGDSSYSYDNISTIYTPDLSQESDIDKINRIIMQNNSLLNSKIEEQTKIIEEQNDTAKDTNRFLKDNSFDSSDLNIPTDTTTDITKNGIDNIFTQIYNGFTSGQATDMVIPIPFTGKSFTINSNLTSNVLNSNGFGWLKTIIEAFWWYIISTFIVKDISKKINKIKSGDFENIETNNIKEDML